MENSYLNSYIEKEEFKHEMRDIINKKQNVILNKIQGPCNSHAHKDIVKILRQII